MGIREIIDAIIAFVFITGSTVAIHGSYQYFRREAMRASRTDLAPLSDFSKKLTSKPTRKLLPKSK